MTEFGVIDYRKNGHVIVQETENTFIVTLKFFFRVTDEDYEGDCDVDAICKNWCSKWSADDIKKCFEDDYVVYKALWVDHCSFEMEIEKPEKHNGDVFSLEYMRKRLRYDCLEDTFYEGGTEKNFWCVPYPEI